MPWRSLEAVLEPVEEEFKVWDRAELDRDLSAEHRSEGATAAIMRRNIQIRADHRNGATLAGLMEGYGLSQRQVHRILRQGR